MELDVVKMIFGVLGGLGIFLLGMKNMSDGMQAVAGDRMRKLIGMITNNRILACGLGTLVTCIIQSSSVTTVMVVGLVNAGLMTLMQAIGVILGANIGTTITAWIMAFSVDKYGLPIIGVSALFFLFSRKEKMRYLAMFVLGLGMVFYGLELMKYGFAPLQKMEGFQAWFSRFEPTNYIGVLKCAAVGAILTGIVQSSSATIGITMALTYIGAIEFNTAAALVLGENIGTTVTALLASIGTTTNARRAALAHTMFNVIGVIWITIIFTPYLSGVVWFVETFQGGHDPGQPVTTGTSVTYPYSQAVIAATHTGFNVLNTLLFLPFIQYLAQFLKWLMPDKAQKEEPRLTYLDVRMFDTPAIAIEQSGCEVVRMGRIAMEMMADLRKAIGDGNREQDLLDRIFKAERDLDELQKDVVEFVGQLMGGNISHDVSTLAREQIRIADEFESVSDYVASILKYRLKMEDNKLEMSQEGLQDLVKLHDQVMQYLIFVNDALKNEDKNLLTEAKTKGPAITKFMKECRARHLSRVESGQVKPLKSLIYTDMLTSYRRIKDHAFNIAEVIAGEK